MSAKTFEILEQIKSLTLQETSELVKQIETTFDVDASVRGVMPTQPYIIDYVGDEPEVTLFDVVLQEVPADRKIAILKVVRELTGFGLKEAKDFVESVPQVIKFRMERNDAEDIKNYLEGVGAKAHIQ